MAYNATERCLERICEAAAKLGEVGPSLMPDQPWQKIKSLGNVLRHQYDGIEHDLVFQVATIHVPKLAAACEAALQTLDAE